MKIFMHLSCKPFKSFLFTFDSLGEIVSEPFFSFISINHEMTKEVKTLTFLSLNKAVSHGAFFFSLPPHFPPFR